MDEQCRQSGESSRGRAKSQQSTAAVPAPQSGSHTTAPGDEREEREERGRCRPSRSAEPFSMAEEK